jgi:CRP-like cAMP-binding protein
MPISDPAARGRANAILAALAAEEYDRVSSELEFVALPVKYDLLVPDRPVTHIYFPLSGVHSVVALMNNGASVEAGIIGRAGVIGAQEALAEATPTNRCFTQLAGEAVRLPAGVFLDQFRRGGSLHLATFRWMQAYMVQVSQTAACNRLHVVEQRLARWLLMCHDRMESSELALTHEFLAIMLATPRPAITKAIGRLTAPGYITHGRATIVVTDREGLEGASCECYEIVRDAYTRISGRA